MKKVTKKIYLPPWQRWYITPLMIGVWGFITYMEFFSPENTDELGMVGYAFMTILLIGVAAMTWAMTSGKLPAYIIKEERE